MITDFDTNKIYLAKGMTSEKFVDATGHLLGTLHNHMVHWNFYPKPHPHSIFGLVTICQYR